MDLTKLSWGVIIVGLILLIIYIFLLYENCRYEAKKLSIPWYYGERMRKSVRIMSLIFLATGVSELIYYRLGAKKDQV
jgi:hypothetical protein